MALMDSLKTEENSLNQHIADKTKERDTLRQRADQLDREVADLSKRRDDVLQREQRAQAEADAKQREIDRLVAEKSQIAA